MSWSEWKINFPMFSFEDVVDFVLKYKKNMLKGLKKSLKTLSIQFWRFVTLGGEEGLQIIIKENHFFSLRIIKFFQQILHLLRRLCFWPLLKARRTADPTPKSPQGQRCGVIFNFVPVQLHKKINKVNLFSRYPYF